MKDISNNKNMVFEVLTLLIFIIILLFPIFIPLKETISCQNKNCNVRDYSILFTNNSFYDFSDITLKANVSLVPRGGGRISLEPISKCSYSSTKKAESDMFNLEQSDNITLKHVSISDIAFLALVLFLFYVLFHSKKFTKYCIFAVVIRLVYILLI